MKITVQVIGQWLLIILIVYFSFILLSRPTPWIFPDYLNLFIHEAGHLLFWPLGEFMHVLGGSLFQIIFPFCFFLYFFQRKEYFSVAVMLFWVADNIINVSVYMRDAQAMQLLLLGGGETIHDWHWLFTRTGLLPHTQIIANVVFFLGVICLLGSIVGLIYCTWKQTYI